MSKVLDVTDATVEDFIKSNPNGVLIFKASWCGPCKAMAPVFDELSEANESIAFGRIDAQTELETTLKYEVRSIPAMIFFKDGQIDDKKVGIMSKAALQDKIDTLKS